MPRVLGKKYGDTKYRRGLMFSDSNKENIVNVNRGKSSAKGTPKKAKAIASAKKAKSPSPKTQSPIKKTSPKVAKKSKSKKSKKQVEESLNLFGMLDRSLCSVSHKLEVVKTAHKNTQNLSGTIDEWVQLYSSDSSSALLELINFVVESCGSSQRISEEQYEQFQDSDEAEVHKEILESLGAAEATSDTAIYPIIAKSTKFRANFLTFWKKLVGQCRREIIYDNTFLDTLFSWLNGIAQSPVRAFRHTANLAAMHIQSALLSVISKLSTQLAITQRQYDQEKAKADKSKQKLTDLKQNISSTNANIKQIEDLLIEVFNGDCVAYLGEWVIEYPVTYSKNSSLRMLGWALSDRAPEVRLVAVEALTKIYAVDSVATQIDMFTEAFRARMVQMIEDIDIPCAVAAIGLCSQLARIEALEEKDINDVYALISDSDGRIRHRAAEFIQDYLLENVVVTATKERLGESKTKKKNQQSDEKEIETAKLLALFEVLEDRSSHRDLPDYMIEALWGRCAVLTSWDIMTELAMNSNAEIHDSERVLLAKFMNASAKRAVGNEIIPKAKTDPTHTDAQETIEENIVSLTSHFAPILPKLLDKYSMETDIITELVQIPQCFSLDVYSTYGLEQHFKALVSKLGELFMKSVDKEVIGHIAKTLGQFKSKAHKLQREVDVQVSKIIEKTFQSFKRDARKIDSDSTSSSKSAHEDTDEEKSEVYSLMLNVQRLTAIHLEEDIQKVIGTDNNYFESLEHVFGILVKEVESHEEVLMALVDACQLCLLWDVSYIDADNTNRTAQQPIQQNATAFIAHLQTMLLSNSDACKEKAFLQLSDTLITFNRTYRHHKKTLAGLAYDANEELISAIIKYFQAEMLAMDDTSDLAGKDPDEDVVSAMEKENFVCNRKVDFVAALGKLIAYNAFKGSYADYAPEILIHFVDHGKAVAEAIKHFLNLLRKNQTVDFDFMFATLKKKYEAIDLANASAQDSDRVNRLAVRLAGSYGMYFNRSNDLRNSLANLLSKCSAYVAENTKDHALFFKWAAAPFVSKLDGVAAERLLADYDEKLEGLIPEDDDDDFVVYRKALQHVAQNGVRTITASKKAKAAPKGKKAAEPEPEEGDAEKEPETGSPEKATTAKRTPKSQKPKRRNSTTEALPATANKKQKSQEKEASPEPEEAPEKDQEGSEESEEEVEPVVKHKRAGNKTKGMAASKKKPAKGRAAKTVPLKIVESNKRNLTEEENVDLNDSPPKKQKTGGKSATQDDEEEVALPKRKGRKSSQSQESAPPSQASPSQEPVEGMDEEEPVVTTKKRAANRSGKK